MANETAGAADLDQLDARLAGYDAEKGDLVNLMHEVQSRYSYLPDRALRRVADQTGLPLSRIYSLATFFKAFRLQPPGRYLITVCLGTTCRVQASHTILAKLERRLGIKPGQTTADGRFTLETVHCIGACALSPVVMVEGDTFVKMNITKVDALLQRYAGSDEGGSRRQEAAP